MLKDIAGLSLRDQLKRIEGAKSEFERLLSQDEINLAKNAAQKVNVATMLAMSLAVLRPVVFNPSLPCPENSILILSAFILCNLGPCTIW
jgi:hypothetical protein